MLLLVVQVQVQVQVRHMTVQLVHSTTLVLVRSMDQGSMCAFVGAS